VAVRCWVDPARRVVFYRFAGIVTRDDLFAGANASVSDPSYEVGFDELADYSGITESKVASEDVRALIEGVSKGLDVHGRRWRIAIAAPSDVAYGLSRMFELLRSQSQEEVHVFRSLEEACACLGITPDDLPWRDESP